MVNIIKNGCTYSGDRLNDFRVGVVKDGHGLLVQETVKSAAS